MTEEWIKTPRKRGMWYRFQTSSANLGLLQPAMKPVPLLALFLWCIQLV